MGIITTAAKGDAAQAAHLEAAIQSMMQLNRRAAELAQQVTVHAMTDVTGFALLGHGYEMASLSGVRLRFYFDRLPFLPGAKEYAEQWLFPGGSCRQPGDLRPPRRRSAGWRRRCRLLLFTPETSGGLLIALPPGEADRLEALCREAGQPVWRVGEAFEGEGIEILAGLDSR